MERTDREPKEPHLLNAEFVDVQSKIVSLSEAGGSDNQEKISELKIQRNNLLEDKRVKYKLDQVRRQAIEALNTSDNFDQFDRKLNNLIDDDSSDSMNDIRKEALYQIRLQAHLQVKTDAIKKRFEEDPSINLTDEYNALQEDKEYKKFERVRFFEPADSESEVDFNTPYQEFIQRQKKDNSDDFDISEELRTDEDTPAKPFRPQPLSPEERKKQQNTESDEDDDFERFVLRGEPKDEDLTDEEREAELDALLDEEVGSVDNKSRQQAPARRERQTEIVSPRAQELRENSRIQYDAFLNEERWPKRIVPEIRPDMNESNTPLFYRGDRVSKLERMSDPEREEHRARRELLNIVFKKSDCQKLEEFANLREYREFKNKEAKVLEDVPGMVEARAIYINTIQDNQQVEVAPGVRLRWSDIGKKSEDIELYRDYIKSQVREAVLKGQQSRGRLQDENNPDFQMELDKYSRDAEQVAFNFLYATGFFDSRESVWSADGKKRIKKLGHGSPAVNGVLVGAMYPVDNMVSNALRVDFRGKDQFSILANKWFKEEIKNKKFEQDAVAKNVGEIEILDNTTANKNKFWTIDKRSDGKYNIKIFSPFTEPSLLKSFLEKTKINGSNALELAKAGKKIDWDLADSNIWSDITSDAGNINSFLEFIQGAKRLKGVTSGGGTDIKDWEIEVSAALGKVGKGSDKKVYRNALYGSSALNPTKRAPEIDSTRKSSIRRTFTYHSFIISKSEEMFYPWDKEGFWD